MNNYNELVSKLKEIFQIDKPELDFGIYRILNARADEINDYLDNKLKAKVQAALTEAGNANKEELEKQLVEAIKGAEALGVDPNDIPKVKDLKNQIAQLKHGANEHESAVFSHLLTFFSRYYDNGDFISKRRYKGDTYSIPYAGEEVMLHWANKDQYYIKSGENFANYSFKLDDGRKVSFRLLAADTAKDNRKDNDADRRFVLIEPHKQAKLDENGEEYEIEYQPVETFKKDQIEELVIYFEYKAMKKGTKQSTLIQAAISTVLENELVQSFWTDISKRAPTEKNPNRTVLERHLTTYTQRNTADYFIHKNLGTFLNNELDFYIKNEVMNLDSVQNSEVFANIEKQLRMIQCYRNVAKELITFLSQLENFQKKIWTKKKFVVESNYLIPLGLLPNRIVKIIINDAVIRKQWHDFGVVDANKGELELLGDLERLIVDTSLLSFSLKEEVLNNLTDIDKICVGTLVKGDNTHGLRLLETKYSSQVDLIHIDPPYNTDTSGFLYKNNFRSSSWLTMMSERILSSSNFLKTEGVFCCHIDEHEIENLTLITNGIFSCHLGTMIWDKGAPVTGKHGLASQHEYVTWHSKNTVKLKSKKNNLSLMVKKAKEIAIKSERKSQEDITKAWRAWLKSQPNMSKSELIYDLLDEEGKPFRSADMTATDQRTDDKYFRSLAHPVSKKECPVPKFGWRYKPETMDKLVESGAILYGKDENKLPRRKIYLVDNPTSQLPSIIRSGFRGKQELDNLGLEFPFAHSSKFYSQLINSIQNEKNSFVLDFFGGSGTTAHAVISSNRSDDGNRKFCLMEMGKHFDDTLKPRVFKLMSGDDWKKGCLKTSGKAFSGIVKTITLESYEDALNNIELVINLAIKYTMPHIECRDEKSS